MIAKYAMSSTINLISQLRKTNAKSLFIVGKKQFGLKTQLPGETKTQLD